MTGYVEIGSVGWDHEQWLGNYYPDDLPSDWLFSYFSKQFQTVWLEPDKLVSQSNTEIESWLDDCDTGFDFLLELPSEFAGSSFKSWLEAATILDKQILGYVLPVSVPVANSQESLSALISEVFDVLIKDSDKALFLLPENDCTLTLEGLPQADKLEIVATFETIADCENTQTALLNFDSKKDLRDLGQFLNAFVNQNTQHACLYCYFKGTPPSYSLMQSAQSIVSILDT